MSTQKIDEIDDNARSFIIQLLLEILSDGEVFTKAIQYADSEISITMNNLLTINARSSSMMDKDFLTLEFTIRHKTSEGDKKSGMMMPIMTLTFPITDVMKLHIRTFEKNRFNGQIYLTDDRIISFLVNRYDKYEKLIEKALDEFPNVIMKNA